MKKHEKFFLLAMVVSLLTVAAGVKGEKKLEATLTRLEGSLLFVAYMSLRRECRDK